MIGGPDQKFFRFKIPLIYPTRSNPPKQPPSQQRRHVTPSVGNQVDINPHLDDKMAVPPLVGALLKNEQDSTLFEKLMFMQRHNR